MIVVFTRPSSIDSIAWIRRERETGRQTDRQRWTERERRDREREYKERQRR